MCQTITVAEPLYHTLLGAETASRHTFGTAFTGQRLAGLGVELRNAGWTPTEEAEQTSPELPEEGCAEDSQAVQARRVTLSPAAVAALPTPTTHAVST